MIHRAKHKGDYTRINNAALRDTTLSDGARSLLFYMLSMSDEWSFSVRSLASQFNVAKSTIDARIMELKEKGYIETTSIKGKGGRFESCVWDVYESPRPKITEYGKNRVPISPSTEKTASRKIRTIRTINIKEQSNIKNNQIVRRDTLGIYQNVFLSDDDQETLINRYGDKNTAEYIDRLSNYLNEHPEKNYKNHKATIEKWIKEDERRLAN